MKKRPCMKLYCVVLKEKILVLKRIHCLSYTKKCLYVIFSWAGMCSAETVLSSFFSAQVLLSLTWTDRYMQKSLPRTWSGQPDGRTCTNRSTLPLNLLVMPHYAPVSSVVETLNTRFSICLLLCALANHYFLPPPSYSYKENQVLICKWKPLGRSIY